MPGQTWLLLDKILDIGPVFIASCTSRRVCRSSGESSSLRWPRRRRGRGRGSGPRRPPYTTWRTTKSRYRSAVPGVRVARFQHGCYFWQTCSEMQQQQAQVGIMYSSRFTEGTCQMPPRLLSRRSTTSSSSPHWTKVRERTRLDNSVALAVRSIFFLAGSFRGENKGLFVLLSRTQTGPGRTVKQEQEEISRNHVPRLFLGSVFLCNKGTF